MNIDKVWNWLLSDRPTDAQRQNREAFNRLFSGEGGKWLDVGLILALLSLLLFFSIS